MVKITFDGKTFEMPRGYCPKCWLAKTSTLMIVTNQCTSPEGHLMEQRQCPECVHQQFAAVEKFT